MALPNVDIIRSDGNITRSPATEDGISGLVEYGTHGAGQYKIFQTSDALEFCSLTSSLYFHISEYFRFSTFPLYVQTVNSVPSTFSELVDLKNFSVGEIRNMGILNLRSTYTSSQITALQTVGVQCDTEYAPLYSIVLSSNLNSTTGLTDLVTLKTLASNKVSFNIAEDLTPGSPSAAVRTLLGWCGSVGTQLGVLSLSTPGQNIAWVQNFNLVGAYLSVPGFITGDKLSAISKTQLDTLHGYHYTFFRRFVGGSQGVYFNFDWTCADEAITDFSEIRFNAVYSKAFRNLRTVLIPTVNSNLVLDDTGSMTLGTIIYFKTIGEGALQQMLVNQEISAFSIDIDPAQKPLTDNTVHIVARIIPTGCASYIEVTLGFDRTLQ